MDNLKTRLPDNLTDWLNMYAHAIPKDSVRGQLLEMQTEIERLQDALAAANNARKDTCMCGSPMDSHSVCNNHAPVSEFDYFIGTLKE